MPEISKKINQSVGVSRLVDMQHKKFLGTASLAKAVGKSPMTIERAIRAKSITPDAVLVTPSGRELALFKEEIFDLLIDQQPQEKS